MALPLHASVERKAGTAAAGAPSVLLADDDPAKRVALAEALEGLVHDLYVAGDGEEALRLLLKREYAVILLDINMPAIDGFEIARLVRERPQSRQTPILFITAHRDGELDMRRGYALGAVDYIFGPVSPAVLRAKVAVFLELERARRKLEDEVAARRRAAREIEQLNAALRERAAELETANQELDRFTASVAHDLRAPLRAIDGYARMVEEDSLDRLDAEGRRLLKMVRDESRRMDRLIENLLAFARYSREPIEPAEIDMAGLARAVYGELQNGDAERTPALRIAEMPRGRGDPALIRQVWSNLLSNAVKYCAREPHPVIEVRGRVEGAENVYWVRDNGAGFDMRQYDRLFGLFQRLHDSPQFPGVGAGLAIVERLVTRHGGRVWAEGRPNEGAAFYFTLPRSA